MGISVRQVDLRVLNMKTRMPFRYGMASLVALPHLFLQVEADVDGRTEVGLSAEGLPPKWFTKDPDTSFAEDLVEMLGVIGRAGRIATQIGSSETVFEFWQALYRRQKDWADASALPPLLWGLGVALVERALIDAFCRAHRLPFARALHENRLGIRLEAVYAELAGLAPSDLLKAPRRSVNVRHTVGLSDPLREADVPDVERLDDGLPQSLEASLRAYGLTHLKVKLCGDAGQDLARLNEVARVATRAGEGCAFTLDGNEQFTDVASLRALWDAVRQDSDLRVLRDRLLFLEQPLRRDVALSAESAAALLGWADRPTLIVDESDGTLSTTIEALEGGYHGTSHKNCKGVFKGIANACLIEHRRRADPEGRYLLSSEDLCCVGPVALLQDLATVACLSVDHSERNGHHYLAGLSAYPKAVQDAVLAHHGTLYRRGESGFPTLDIRKGRIDLDTVLEAPYGYAFDLDISRFTPLDDWSIDSLELA